VLCDGRLLSYAGYLDMAVWDPQARIWNSVGPDLTSSYISTHIPTNDGGFVVGGRSLQSDGRLLGAAAKWHPTTGWRSIPTVPYGRIDAMTILRDGRIAATGQQFALGNQQILNNAIWDGEAWIPMGDDRAQTWMTAIMELPNGDILVSGTFSGGGNLGMEGLARYRQNHIPVVTLQPSPRSVRIGREVHFSVQATGDRLTYRWRRNGVDLASGGRVRGAASATIRLFGVQETDAGLYECLVTNPCGSTISAGAFLSVGPAIGSCDYDLTRDGNVDLTDAQLIAQIALGLLEPDPAWLDGDVDADGQTTIQDAQVLAQFVASGVCGL
jgi:hypothetical protein